MIVDEGEREKESVCVKDKNMKKRGIGKRERKKSEK
jgi:hypothetical protein